MAIIETISNRQAADGFLNFTATLVDNDGNEHKIPFSGSFPLFGSKKVHKALMDHPELATEDGRVKLTVTSVNVVKEDDTEIAFG